MCHFWCSLFLATNLSCYLMSVLLMLNKFFVSWRTGLLVRKLFNFYLKMAFCLTFEKYFFLIKFVFFLELDRYCSTIFWSSLFRWEIRWFISWFYYMWSIILSLADFSIFLLFLGFSNFIILCLRVAFFLDIFFELLLGSLWLSSNLGNF